MKKTHNIIINEMSDIINPPNNNVIQENEAVNFMLNSSISLSENQAIELLKKSTLEYLNNNYEDNEKYRKIYERNISSTSKEKQEIYWNLFKSITSSTTKKKSECQFPKLPFGKELNDADFLKLLKETLDYASFTQEDSLLKYMNDIFKNIEKYTLNIFKYPKILKELKQDAILSFIIADTKRDKADSLDVLKIKRCTFLPLLELDFIRDHINYVLNKNELKNIYTSKVIISFYKNNLEKFINDFSTKIKNDEALKEKINSYIDNYNIYFCKLPTHTMALTIFTGNIYLRIDYLQNYFEVKSEQIICEDDLIIIRQKIILNIQHELNHVLIRIIDPEKNANFFLKSNNHKTKSLLLEFKDKYIKDKFHNFSGQESGNTFDYDFYMGYYFDKLSIKEANFFLDVKTMNSQESYKNNFKSILIPTINQNYYDKNSSINKFNRSDNNNNLP